MITTRELFNKSEELTKAYSTMDIDLWRSEHRILAELAWTHFQTNPPFDRELSAVIARAIVFWDKSRKEQASEMLWDIARTTKDDLTQTLAASILDAVCYQCAHLSLEGINLKGTYSSSFCNMINRIQNAKRTRSL
jgi:hypothetical protein